MSKAKPGAKVIPFPKADQKLPVRPSPPANPETPSFALFGQAIAAGEIEAAGGLLMALVDLDAKTALAAAEHLHRCYVADPAIMVRAQQLRQDISANRINDALMAIHACFGLQGLAALQLLAGFTRRLG